MTPKDRSEPNTVVRVAQYIKDAPDTYPADLVHWAMVRIWRIADKEMPMGKNSFALLDIVKEFYEVDRAELG